MASSKCTYLNCREVAAITGMSLSWVYLHVQSGATPRLPHVRLGRAVKFRRGDIEALLRHVEVLGSIAESQGVTDSGSVS